MSLSQREDLPPAPLVVGTPEHEAYYYEKIERTLYDGIKYWTTRFPYSITSMTWLSLGDAGQKAVIEKVKNILCYGIYDLDIEDQKEVKEVAEMIFRLTLASTANGVGADKSNKRTPPASKKSGKGHSLLKTAIYHSRVEKQTRSPTSSILS